MKSLFTLIASCFASLCIAAEVRLTWSSSPSPAVTGYYVYAFTNSIADKPAIKIDVGTNLIASVESLRPGIWTFTATAYTAEKIESDFATPITTEVPPSPAQMRTITLQYNTDLSSTNWQDAGFFRVKIQ